MEDFNPYSAPEAGVAPGEYAAEVDEGRGVWRDENTLVMAKFARLPSRCVTCNAPATYRLRRTLSWHSRWLFLMVIFPGLLFYIIVAVIVRQTAKIAVPLCDRHRDRRSKGILIGWVVSLSGIAACIAPAFAPPLSQGNWTVVVVGLGIAMILGGLIFGSNRSQVVTPRKIDKTHAWLGKVGPAYLDSLPRLPGIDDDGSKGPVHFLDGP